VGISPEQLILWSAQACGILPVTSVCNVACIFCSNHQNPADVEIVRIPHRTLAQIAETLTYLIPQGKIIIGESASRINEGEPFCHPEIREILTMVRNRFPDVLIQVTTNGSRIDDSMVRFIQTIMPVEIYLSLNSADPEWRSRLMADPDPMQSIQAPVKLSQATIPYHGSLVAMPHITGYDDIRKTIAMLDRHQAKTIRVFYPGFTKASGRPPFSHTTLMTWLDGIANDFSVPILPEPPFIQDLVPRIEGVLPDSPAARCGLRRGDVILQVAGIDGWSRVDVFRRIRDLADPDLVISRNQMKVTLRMEKKQGALSGLVMHYDLDPERILDALHVIHRHRAQQVLIISSTLAWRMVCAGFQKESPADLKWRVQPAENRFFGGTIKAAGLLLVNDYLQVIAQTISAGECPDLILIPEESFDPWGRDLIGCSYGAIRESFGINVELV